MKSLLVLIAVLLGAHQGQAQGDSQDQGVEDVIARPAAKKKRIVHYDEAADEVVESEPVASPPRNPIYIMNNQKYQGYQSAQQRAVQEQPVSIVEANPLKESRADLLRKSRQDIETHTEQKIVEKLEEARIDDEKNRADRLFGAGFGSGLSQQPAMQPVQQVQPLPPVVAPVAAPAEIPADTKRSRKSSAEDVEDTHTSMREEIRDAMRDLGPQAAPEEKPSYYVGAQVGMAHYPDVVNVRGNIASGFSLGMVTPERIVVEGGFLYSNYDVEILQPGISSNYPPFKNLQQYNMGAALKFQLLPGRIRPVLGAAADYTYRVYSDRQNYRTQQREVSTGAFDVGVVAGLDVELTKSFSLGVDFRYYTNIASRTNSDYQQSFVNYQQQIGTPIEKLDYYIATLIGKFTF